MLRKHVHVKEEDKVTVPPPSYDHGQSAIKKSSQYTNSYAHFFNRIWDRSLLVWSITLFVAPGIAPRISTTHTVGFPEILETCVMKRYILCVALGP